MWNAKGFLSRIEKLADGGEFDRGSNRGEENHTATSTRNERNEDVSMHGTVSLCMCSNKQA